MKIIKAYCKNTECIDCYFDEVVDCRRNRAIEAPALWDLDEEEHEE